MAEYRTAGGALEKVPEHGGGEVKFCDYAVLHRAHSNNGARGFPKHLFCPVAYSNDFFASLLYCDHGRLTQYDAFAPHIDDGVGGSQIDSDIFTHDSILSKGQA